MISKVSDYKPGGIELNPYRGLNLVRPWTSCRPKAVGLDSREALILAHATLRLSFNLSLFSVFHM